MKWILIDGNGAIEASLPSKLIPLGKLDRALQCKCSV